MVSLVQVACTMSDVRFPYMRAEIIGAINSLADPDYQWRVWIERIYPHENYYDDFGLNVHILYDDTHVLEDPVGAIGAYLRSQEEAAALIGLAEALDTVFSTLGTELADIEYVRSPLWGRVVESARSAARVLTAEQDQ
jgi:hypothetical protein